MKLDYSKLPKRPIAVSKGEALQLAAKALQAWREYGEAMRQHGRGAECTLAATGYSTENLVRMLESAV